MNISAISGFNRNQRKRLFSRPTEPLWVATCVHNTLHTPCGPQRELYEWCNLSRGSLPSAGFPLSRARRKQPLSLTFLPCPPASPCIPLRPPASSAPSAEGDRFLKSHSFCRRKKTKTKKTGCLLDQIAVGGETSRRSPPPTAVHNAFHMLAQEPRGTLYLTSGTDHLCNGHSRPQTIRL